MSLEREGPRVTCLSWNNEGTNLAVGLTSGFIIYSTEMLLDSDGSLREVIRRSVAGGVSIVALHGQSNLVVLVGWEKSHRDTVTVHDLSETDACDDGESPAVLARVKLSSAVCGVRFHPRLVIVGLEGGFIKLFDHTLRTVKSFQASTPTRKSPRRVEIIALGTTLVEKLACGISHYQLYGVVLGPKVGTVRCICYASERHLRPGIMRESIPDFVSKFEPELTVNIVELHRNDVGCITITPDGLHALTVSERGTSLKLLDVEKHTVIGQFSRGTTPNMVHTLGLLVTSVDIIAACISDSGTFHFFHLRTANSSYYKTVGEVNEEERNNGIGFIQAWSDYRNSVAPKSRLAIPEDDLYKSLCMSESSGKSVYSLVLRHIPMEESYVAHVVQRCILPRGVTNKARLLSVQVESSAEEQIKIVHSYYFPRDEI